jgi:hypothetical protein
MCVFYEGRVSVKPCSAPGGWQVVVAADQLVVAWTSHLFRRDRPWCRAAGGGSIKPAAVAQQGHDTPSAPGPGFDRVGTAAILVA